MAASVTTTTGNSTNRATRLISDRLSAWSLLLAVAVAGAEASPAPFSTQPAGPPAAGWEVTEIKGREPTQFRIVTLDGRNVLEASSDAAAAGLVFPAPTEGEQRRIEFDWKIARHIPGTDMTRKSGDDFAARVYLTFARDPRELSLGTRVKIRLARLLYGQDVPAAAICYVWAPVMPTGTIMPNAYSDTVIMFVADSGPPDGTWRRVSRDYAADYREVFGGEAPALTSVVVATDSDDTGGTSLAWFGDLVLR